MIRCDHRETRYAKYEAGNKQEFAMNFFKSLMLATMLMVVMPMISSFTPYGAAWANGGPDPEPEPPKPEPPKPGPQPVHDGGDDYICPSQSDEAAVLKRVGELTVGEDVTVRDGDRTVTALGGNHEVVKVLSSRRVCVKKEKTSSTKVAPAAEKRQCNAPTGYVCPDVYVGGKAD